MNIDLYNCDCISGAKEYLKSDSVDLIITDPPYGIKGDQLHKHYHRKEHFVIDGYVEIPEKDYPQFSIQWIKEAERVLKPGGSIYIVSGYSNLYFILHALRQTSLQEINHLIWKYNFGVYTSQKYISSHYHILYYVKPGGKPVFNTFARYANDEKDTLGGSLNYQDREDVWIIKRQYKHGTTKNKNELPDELLIKLIQYSSNEGDVVADFFLGGFSTAKIAVGLNRSIVGFEINQQSFDFHIKEINEIVPGYLMSFIRTGKNNLPANQKKKWSQEDVKRLGDRFEQLLKQTGNKRKTIELLQKEFERGYFSILNKLEMLQKEK